MTTKEIAKVLAILKATYPQFKIEDAKSTVMAWESVLGSYSADSVMKAVKLHMETSKFFPAPAEIKQKVVRAEMIYTDTEPDHMPLLTEGQQEQMSPERLDYIIKFVGFPDETDKKDNSALTGNNDKSKMITDGLIKTEN